MRACFEALFERASAEERQVLLELARKASRRDLLRGQRDAAIRSAALVLFPQAGPRTWAAATALAQELGRYAASAWRMNQHLAALPESAPPRHQVLHQVLALSEGRVLQARQLWSILAAPGAIAAIDPG